MNWIATNNATGVSYNFTDAQKAFYEDNPHLRNKYRYKAVAAPKGVEKVETKDGKKVQAQAETEK